MTSKYQIILCDTCVIIELFRLNLWESFISIFDVAISGTIVEESMYYIDNQKQKHSIDLKIYINSKKIKEVSVSSKSIEDFYKDFDPSYQDRLDLGELELLSYLFNNKSENIKICSADGIVFKILGRKLMSEKGISLEELLINKFPKKQIRMQFTKKWKEQYLQEGLQLSDIK